MGSQIHPSRQIDAGTQYGHNSIVSENVGIGDSRERTTPMGSHIHPSCQIGAGTRYGHNTVISENVRIGDNCQIGHGVVIHPDTVIGNGVRIDDNSVIGKLPMKAALSAITKEQELPPCEVADSCLIGALTILYRGCKLGTKVMVADLASIRENVEVGEYTIVGRGVTVENNVKIGKRCKLETESYITALSEIEDGCFIAPEVTFTNDNFLGRTKGTFQISQRRHSEARWTNWRERDRAAWYHHWRRRAGRSGFSRDSRCSGTANWSWAPRPRSNETFPPSSCWTINSDAAFLIHRRGPAPVRKGGNDRRRGPRT